MNKILITLFVLFASFNSYAENDIENARRTIATSLNGVVKDLKSQFQPLDSSLNKNNKEMTDLDKTVDELVEKSAKKEINPTILIHGDTELKADCNYDSENLNWTGSKWTCLPASISTDCIPASDEYKELNESGQYSCVKKGTYVNESFGWSVCDNSKGEQETVVRCLFENKKNKQQSHVDSNLCSNKVDRFKQPCGENGGNSSCKCPTGYVYSYKDGSASCEYSDIVKHMETIKHTRAGYLSASVANNIIALKGWGPDTKSCRHDKMTVKFNLEKSKIDAVNLRFFFKRGGRIYVNGKIIFGIAGARSIKKPFKKIISISKTSSTSYGSHDRYSSPLPPGTKLCGSVYHNSGAYILENDGNCAYTCDLKNNRTSDRVFGAKTHTISLDHFVEGENTIIFDRVWGNYGGTDSATFTFVPKNSGVDLSLPLPQCKI
tara:strand:- start:138 stop:1442 length:1305 start_codon:yes stop_codon:yes gene_type:complete